jgi:hypothetical protein
LITVAIDPGTTSTGAAIFGGDGHKYLYSNQGKPNDIIKEILWMCEEVDILAVENLYPGPGKAGPKSIYTLGCVTGYIMGQLKPICKVDTRIWRPYPVSWRKYISMSFSGQETTMNAKNREHAAAMAVKFAEEASGESMVGPRGGPQVDRAMAVCIAIAAQAEFSMNGEGQAKGVEAWMKMSSGLK